MNANDASFESPSAQTIATRPVTVHASGELQHEHVGVGPAIARGRKGEAVAGEAGEANGATADRVGLGVDSPVRGLIRAVVCLCLIRPALRCTGCPWSRARADHGQRSTKFPSSNRISIISSL